MILPTDVRIEHDLIGDRPVLVEAYYGVHRLRAVENFLISGQRIFEALQPLVGLHAIFLRNLSAISACLPMSLILPSV